MADAWRRGRGRAGGRSRRGRGRWHRSGAVEGPGVVEADVGVEGRGGEDDVAPGAGDEGEGGEEGGGEVHGELDDAGKELGRDGVDERSGGEEESATGGEEGELGSEGSNLGVEIDDVSWSRTVRWPGQRKRGVSDRGCDSDPALEVGGRLELEPGRSSL